MSTNSSPLLEIINKLKATSEENNESYRVTLNTVNSLSNSLEKLPTSIEDFKTFLTLAHNVSITGDSSKRSAILRAMRLTMQSEAYVKAILAEDYQWIVVTSMERDNDYSMERMQAFKLMEKIRILAPLLYPVCFGRSLVAIANHKDDNFRTLSLEALRELSIANAKLVAQVNGFACLLDAVIEPITQDMADNILLTILFLLNDPQTRKIVKPQADLRALLAAFTDLDTDPADMAPRWKAAKHALVLMMRSWVGVVLITSEDMGLPTLVRMLQDPKVPVPTQEVILEAFGEVLAPVSAKVNYTNRSRQQQLQTSFLQDQKLTTHSSSSQLNAMSPGGNPDVIRVVRSNSGSQLVKQNSGNMSGGALGGGTVGGSASAATPRGGATGDNLQKAHHRASFSFSDNIFGSLTHHGTHASMPNTTAHSGSSNSLSGMKDNTASATRDGKDSKFSISSFFGGKSRDSMSSPTGVVPRLSKRLSATVIREASGGSVGGGTNSTNNSSHGSQGSDKADYNNNGGGGGGGGFKFLRSSSSQSDLLAYSNTSSSGGGAGGPKSPGSPPLAPNERRANLAAGVVKQRLPLSNPTGDFDPIFNMLDNYTALVCCSFLHANLVPSLFFLGSNGVMSLASKSRALMVNYMRILANIFPENKCSDLLTIPALLEFAAAAHVSTSRAHKASQILLALADAFSLMPYKQVSGMHISGLSNSANSISSRNRAPSAALAPNKPPASTPQGNTSTASAGSNRSNFSPLNIQTIYELAEEIKISSFSNISTLTIPNDPGASQHHIIVPPVDTASVSTLDVIKTLRASLTPIVDKNDFTKQMDQSRVIGKEGKEPFKWDWVCISDMLEYSFQHSDRLSEALKTKWVRRVSGFYRCSIEEKGYFANLDWEPTNLQYLECACNMYTVLLRDEAGTNFLNSDRRGMLFSEIAHEIEQLAQVAGSKNIMTAFNAPKNVFRLYSCTCTMAREFFTLLGRIVRTTESREFLDTTNIFQHMSKLANYNTLDYVSRLVMTSLSFTDGGFLSKHLMQLWTTQTNCSPELHIYFHSLLRVLLRSKNWESAQWCVDSICNQLTADEYPSEELYKALEEAIHNKSHLKDIISKRPKILQESMAQELLVRFAAIPEGIEFLAQKDWLETALQNWQANKCSEYVYRVEEKISVALQTSNASNASISSSGVSYAAAVNKKKDGISASPIPIQTPEFISAINARNSFYGQSSGGYFYGGSSSPSKGSPGVAAGGKDAGDQSSSSTSNNADGFNNRDPNAGLMADLHGLMRVPWNIEVKLTPTATYQGGSFTGSSSTTAAAAAASQAPAEYLKVDTFLDTRDFASPLCFETSSSAHRLIKVRGIILDAKGAPIAQPVAHNKIISSTLLAGICPIARNGKVSCNVPEGRPQRRKSSITNTRESMTSAVTRPSIAMTTAAALVELTNDSDVPVSSQPDLQFDWCSCKPGHRQGNVTELGEGLFSVSVPGDPVVWIFSRRAPGAAPAQRLGRSGSLGLGDASSAFGGLGNNSPSRNDFSRAGNLLYLVEVQYYFRLETGHAMFVPMPRHLYGELARTLEGCAHLNQKNIIVELLNTVHRRVTSDSSSTRLNSSVDMRSALWALGHIAATELGFSAINNVDPMFVEWCLENICSNPNISLRGTFFYVVGLLSRTTRGARKLAQSQWDSAVQGGNSAVAFPRNPGVLFRPLGVGGYTPAVSVDLESSASTGSCPPNVVKQLLPFAHYNSNSVDVEVLNLIAKLPGVIVYRECKSRLDHIKRDHPEVFQKRELYLNVHRVLESYTFKLSARREILAMFGNEAKLRDASLQKQQSGSKISCSG